MQEQSSSSRYRLGLKATMLLEIQAILKDHLVSLIDIMSKENLFYA